MPGEHDDRRLKRPRWPTGWLILAGLLAGVGIGLLIDTVPVGMAVGLAVGVGIDSVLNHVLNERPRADRDGDHAAGQGDPVDQSSQAG
ncbi:MAG: AtpZ/AtpI family protein [Anaerolineae bacterium]|nr:AtpZ/AtpI family protein [Anaerolineae bacterium]